MPRIVAVAIVAGVLFAAWQLWPRSIPDWTTADIAILQSLALSSLPEVPADPSNAVADNPLAIAFGQKLFNDPRLSGNGGISCATCHQPIRRFSDGLPRGQAIGTSKRNTPSIVGMAYSPWFYWDGRRDSLWSQALSPLEDENEHATDRTQVVDLIAADEDYRATYQSLFGDLPEARDPVALDHAFANIGKAIAAFERTILPTAAPFDDYVAAVSEGDEQRQSELFSEDEVRGLGLFIGEASCLQCHNGPLFTNHEFHNTGLLSWPSEIPDVGRVAGVREVMTTQFNCRSEFSDDAERRCDELDFARDGVELIGAMKTPSLRNLDNTAPFMHKGQLATLQEVLLHYNEAADAMIGHNEAEPLNLNRRELAQLEAFLLTLTAPVSVAGVIAE